MGYNLEIGEALPNINLEERHVRLEVEYVAGEPVGAPINSQGDYGNSISAGYIVWHRFCGAVGLLEEFYAPDCPEKGKRQIERDSYSRVSYTCEKCNDGRKSHWWEPQGPWSEEHSDRHQYSGLLREQNKECHALTQDHLDSFEAARKRWLARSEEGRAEGRGEDGVDYVLRRLDWLCFWTEWALKNCKYPSFAHS